MSVKKSSKLILIIAVCLILSGILFLIRAFHQSDKALFSEHNDHLLDIAWSTDKNLSTLIRRISSEIDVAINFTENVEQEFIATHDPALLSEYLRSLPFFDDRYKTEIMVLEGEEIIYYTGENSIDGLIFPNGWQNNSPILIYDESGDLHLAVVRPSHFTDLYYVVLIDFADFYGAIAGEELTTDYWLVLYDKDVDLFLQNDFTQPEYYRYTAEEALARGDGLSIIVSAEQSGEIITKSYKFVDRNNVSTDNIIAVIPSVLSNNGFFAVAVAISSDHIAALLRNVFRSLMICGVMIIIGIFIILYIFFQNRRQSMEMREKIDILRREKEELQELEHRQRLELIGTMTSGIAHEFNNMLTPIMGYSVMTMQSIPEDNETAFDNLNEIYDASLRAKSLVARISDLSKKNNKDANRMLSANVVLDKVVEMAMPAKPHMVELVRDYHCDGENLFANEMLLNQMLLNIVINAFQAIEDVGGTVTVSTFESEDHIEFRINNTGSKVSDEVLKKIFDPFFTTKGSGKGTGLGLAIAKNIAEEHGGTISVNSSDEAGTTFIISLPKASENDKSGSIN